VCVTKLKHTSKKRNLFYRQSGIETLLPFTQTQTFIGVCGVTPSVGVWYFGTAEGGSSLRLGILN
jgi:hypothetical protein